MNQTDFAELLSRTLAVFQWAIHEKYGATREDFGELYLLMTLKLTEAGGFGEIVEELRAIGLDIDCEV